MDESCVSECVEIREEEKEEKVEVEDIIKNSFIEDNKLEEEVEDELKELEERLEALKEPTHSESDNIGKEELVEEDKEKEKEEATKGISGNVLELLNSGHETLPVVSPSSHFISTFEEDGSEFEDEDGFVLIESNNYANKILPNSYPPSAIKKMSKTSKENEEYFRQVRSGNDFIEDDDDEDEGDVEVSRVTGKPIRRHGPPLGFEDDDTTNNREERDSDESGSDFLPSTEIEKGAESDESSIPGSQIQLNYSTQSTHSSASSILDRIKVLPKKEWKHGGDKCVYCKEKFTLFNRRHHCRICGNLVCSKCLTIHFAIKSKVCIFACAFRLTCKVFSLKQFRAFHGCIRKDEATKQLDANSAIPWCYLIYVDEDEGFFPVVLVKSKTNEIDSWTLKIEDGKIVCDHLKNESNEAFDTTRQAIDYLERVVMADEDSSEGLVPCPIPECFSKDHHKECYYCHEQTNKEFCKCGARLLAPVDIDSPPPDVPSRKDDSEGENTGSDDTNEESTVVPIVHKSLLHNAYVQKLHPYDIFIHSADIMTTNLICDGRLGRIQRGSLLQETKRVVVKKARSMKNKFELLHEAVALAIVGEHENIVHLAGVAVDTKEPMLVVEYCPERDLYAFISSPKKTRALKHSRLLSFAKGIRNGLSHIADMEMCHGDLACRNVLLTETLVPKLADFDLSVWPGADRERRFCSHVSIRWTSPERLLAEHHAATFASDVWSFGVVLFELFSKGSLPYNEVKRVEDVEEGVVSKELALTPPPSMPEEMQLIMGQCLQFDPASRPTIKDIVFE
eukprot:m.242097 g.242097  ORF g.242097 m.242097 type:complete len:792 (-) comp29839_c0_seq1:220-2595(-)